MDYKTKYLKYKKKYLDLKNGGAFRDFGFGFNPDENSLPNLEVYDLTLDNHNYYGNLNEYFIVIFLYNNTVGKLSTQICSILNNILLNTNVPSSNICLITQFIPEIDETLGTFDYDEILEQLFFDAKTVDNCKQIIQLLKNKMIHHYMIPQDINIKNVYGTINQVISEFLQNINQKDEKDEKDEKTTVHLSIHTHGYNTQNPDNALISIDGTNSGQTMSFNELYSLLLPLFNSDKIENLNILPAFCFNITSFKPMLHYRLNYDKAQIKCDNINYSTLLNEIPLLQLLFYYIEICHTNKKLIDIDTIIKSYPSTYIDKNYLLSSLNDNNIEIEIFKEIFINTRDINNELNTFIYSLEDLNDLILSIYEDTSIDGIIKFYTEYIYDKYNIDNFSSKIKDSFIFNKIWLLPEFLQNIITGTLQINSNINVRGQNININSIFNTYWDTYIKPYIIQKLI